MELEFLATHLKDRLTLSLPGIRAHEPLRAIPIGPAIPFKHKDHPRIGSVLILLYEEDHEIKFPLIKRPVYVGTHSGQVSLPGGKAEAGEDVYQTALRECQEEIGISPQQIEIVGRLSEFFVIASNFLVTPVVGIMREMPIFTPDPFEVAGILKGNLVDIVNDNSIFEKEISVGQYHIRAPHFVIEKEVVWGATAMMLNEFRFIIKEILE